MTDLKQTPSIDWLDAPIKASKWKNAHFMKDGRILLGENIHSSEKVAKQLWDASFNEDGRVFYTFFSKKYHFSKDEYSHTLQLPWKE